MTATVSVVIPTYNGERFLADAVRSVWDQTARPADLLVVDDCSRDGTVALAERLARESPVPMRVVKLPRNSGGPARPINAGLDAAAGEFAAVLDQDDVFVPGRLEWHLRAFAACPGADLVFGRWDTLDPAAEPHGWPGDALDAASVPVAAGSPDVRRLSGLTALRLLLRHHNFVRGFPGFTFRRAAARVDVSFRIAGDYDLLCRLAARGDVGYVAAPGYRRRDHGANASGDALRSNLEVARVRGRQLRAHPELGRDPEVGPYLRAWFTGLGYWARQAGHPAAATRLYVAALRLFGWDRATLAGLAKVWPAWAARKVRGAAPEFSPMTAPGGAGP
jgi:glycosyltransferase involved in cell wall biosynthesis